MTPRLLLIDRLPSAVHARLENGGEVMRGGGDCKPAKSATYDVIKSMHEHAGQRRNLSTHLARSVDLEDAALIKPTGAPAPIGSSRTTGRSAGLTTSSAAAGR